MILYGSNTSPYVRRLRIYCAMHNLTVDYKAIDIFNPEERETLIKHNPARKIPFLICGENTVCDSNVIARYLQTKYSLPHLNWQQENLLTTINACNDSLVEILLGERSGFDTKADVLFFNLQRERITETLTYLDRQCTTDVFLNCEYLQISLYCLLDWIRFRNLADINNHEGLLNHLENWQDNKHAQATDPRS
ncbi:MULTISPECIES: glutathione S-transferase family protein [Pseudoalteromonas]|uniref:Glutathione S-transferase n=1 Tax=Pseudoalteromonas luteoviolacea (strain 2ta16) TaxID=1353533 RepID=V4HY56_PSEL2|nr:MULTISPECIES: glutathione S-transferase N-terminal domain-containing protein [Pseudoalteromonas]ESP92864.1 glutathione S-transferase [Pseudoalteromonas luteoviolacea 2ta16]MCG7546372.1 glutathione S-transferase N-terminal domain-containing protein [Pseudoalteromonas sp. Of7M-16]